MRDEVVRRWLGVAGLGLAIWLHGCGPAGTPAGKTAAASEPQVAADARPAAEGVPRSLPTPHAPPPLAAVPGEFLVKFRAGTGRAAMARVLGKVSLSTSHEFRSVPGLHLIRTGKGEAAVARLKSVLAADAQVEYIEPNYIQRAFAVPDDPEYPKIWGLHNTGQIADSQNPDALNYLPDIAAEAAWDITTGSDDIVVAVIDTGVEYTHEDLAANIWQNPDDCDADGVDDDANGYIDDCHGIDTIDHDSDPMDLNSHGTHVAGIIGAVGNNGIGIAGVAWHVKMMPCRFLGADGSGPTSAAIECLDYIAALKRRGVNIIASNNSWGDYNDSRALEDAIRAQRDLGILFVVAAGNSRTDDDIIPQYPCVNEVANVICVTGAYDFKDWYASYGRGTVLLGAPGNRVYSTVRFGGYEEKSGTSMATPHVTGALVLLKAQDPTRNAYALRNLVAAGTVLPHEQTIATATEGRLNLPNSLTCTDATVLARLRPFNFSPLNRAVGATVTIRALHVRCADPAGEVTVSVVPGGETVTLHDDGAAPDEIAGDGVYAGNWIAHGEGEFTFTFPTPETDTFVVHVDPTLKAGFPLMMNTLLGDEADAGPARLVVGNITGDARPEILALSHLWGPLWAWDADGKVLPGWPRDEQEETVGLGLGNLDDDPSDLEVMTNYWFGMRLYQGDGSPMPGWPLSGGVVESDIPLADLDGDGVDEIIGFPARRADGTVFRNDIDVPAHSLDMFDAGYAPKVADLDADGRLDFVSIASHGFGDALWISDSEGVRDGFPIELPGKFTTVFRGRPLIGDVDGDGTPNIVIPSAEAGGTRDQVEIYDNRGRLLRTLLAPETNSDGMSLADIDGDGIPEIVKVSASQLNVWRGDGTSLPGWPRDLGGYNGWEPAIGDIDGDGAVDIVTAGYDGGTYTVGALKLHAFHADGSYLPGFPRVLDAVPGSASPFAIADLDLDGRSELVVAYGRGLGLRESIFAYDLHGAGPYGPIEWSQSSGDVRHHGYYQTGKNLPNHAYLATQVFGAGRITAAGGGIDCRGDCIEKYAKGTNVVLTAADRPGGSFVRWRGACAAQGNPCTLPMQKFTETSADFDSRVAVAVTGDGSVSSVASGIQCPGECEHVFAARSMVTLTAAATIHSDFAEWTGACTGSDPVCRVFVDDARDVGARFTSVYPLTIAKTGSGHAVVTASAGGIDCGTTCSADLSIRSNVYLTLALAADSYLVSWHRPACPDTLTTCEVVMNAPTTLNVEVALKPVVAVTVVGSGRVVVHPDKVECRASCNVPVNVGDVQINPFGDPGWHFVRWDNPCDGYAGEDSCVLGNVHADVAITAVFERDPTLTVTRSGNGLGSVSSDLGDIQCPSTCSAPIGALRTITLTANASPGSTFTGWGGACSGNGSCAVTVGEENVTVIATFTRSSGGSGSSSGGGGGGRIDWLMLAALALLSAERLVQRIRRLRKPHRFFRSHVEAVLEPDAELAR